MTKLLVLIGGVLLAAGLVAGFVPTSSGGVSCGSAFHASDAAQVSDYATALMGGGIGSAAGDCASSRSTWKVVAWMLIAPGAVLLFAGAVTASSAASAKRPA